VLSCWTRRPRESDERAATAARSGVGASARRGASRLTLMLVLMLLLLMMMMMMQLMPLPRSRLLPRMARATGEPIPSSSLPPSLPLFGSLGFSDAPSAATTERDDGLDEYYLAAVNGGGCRGRADQSRARASPRRTTTGERAGYRPRRSASLLRKTASLPPRLPSSDPSKQPRKGSLVFST
jgi:hypothetical protein